MTWEIVKSNSGQQGAYKAIQEADKPLNAKQVAERLGVRVRNARRSLKRLEQSGQIKKVKRNKVCDKTQYKFMVSFYFTQDGSDSSK